MSTSLGFSRSHPTWAGLALVCALRISITPCAWAEGAFGISNAFVLDTLAFKKGQIGGVVESVGGSPIEGAEISTDRGYSVFSLADGSYVLENVVIGYGYRVAARAPGYAPDLRENVNVYAGQTTTVNFRLTAVSEEYRITELYPPASTISTVYEKGMAIRYYKVLTTSGGTPQGTVRVGWEVRKGGTLIESRESDTNVDGEAMVWANTKDVAAPGDRLTGTITTLNSAAIPVDERPTFLVDVLPAPFEVSYRQRVSGELQGSVLGKYVIGGEAGFELTYPCSSTSVGDPLGMDITRKEAMRGGVGVSGTLFEVGAEYKASGFTAGAGLDIGKDAEVLLIAKHLNRYGFDPNAIFGTTPSWNESAAAYIALNDVLGLGSGYQMGLDAALLYILSWLEQQALQEGGPLNALNNAYNFSEAGLGVAGEAGAKAGFLAGVAGQSQGTIQFGIHGSAALRGKAEQTLDLGYDPTEVTLHAGSTQRLEGTLSTAIGAGADWSPAEGQPRETGVPNLFLLPKQSDPRNNSGFTIAQTAWTRGVGIEYRYWHVYSGVQKRLSQVVFEIAPFSQIDTQVNLRRFVYTATSSDPQVLSRFSNAPGTNLSPLAALAGGASGNLGFGDHAELMFGFIDICNQIANGVYASKLSVALDIYDEPAQVLEDVDFSLKGKLFGTGGKVKLGGRAEEVFRHPVFRGVWRDGRELVLEDYSQADYGPPPVPTYGETNQQLLDTVIIQPLEDAWQRVAEQAVQGVVTVVEVAGKTIEFGADVVSNGAEIIVSFWSMFTSGSGKPLGAGTPEYAVAERVLSRAQEQAGLQFGIGGFLNIQLQEGTWIGTATLTFTYTDQDVDGVDETSLAVFWWDAEEGVWVYVGGTPDPALNQVVATIEHVGTYTLAPVHPEGMIGMNADPASIPAGGTAETLITCGPLLDSAADPVPDGIFYTITTDLGEIVAADELPDVTGIQVASASAEISFGLRSSLIGGTATVHVESLVGRAAGDATVEFADDQPPGAPSGLFVRADDEAAWLSWDENTEPDVAGYRIHYGTQAGGPYEGGASVRGLPSPVDVGSVTRAYLPGLINRQPFYVVVTALDHSNNESAPSPEVPVVPTIKGDGDGDEKITNKDLFPFSVGFGTSADEKGFVPLADLNYDRQVDAEDLLELMRSTESPGAAKAIRKDRFLRKMAW